MIRLKQIDSRWRNVVMKPSSLRLGSGGPGNLGYGCLTTAAAMVADKFRYPITPKEMVEKGLVRYNASGNLLWHSLNMVPGLLFEKRIRYVDHAAIRESLKWNKGVVLAVNDDAHWVAVRGRIPFTNHYWVNDPADGKVKTTLSFRNISGSGHFIMDPEADHDWYPSAHYIPVVGWEKGDIDVIATIVNQIEIMGGHADQKVLLENLQAYDEKITFESTYKAAIRIGYIQSFRELRIHAKEMKNKLYQNLPVAVLQNNGRAVCLTGWNENDFFQFIDTKMKVPDKMTVEGIEKAYITLL